MTGFLRKRFFFGEQNVIRANAPGSVKDHKLLRRFGVTAQRYGKIICSAKGAVDNYFCTVNLSFRRRVVVSHEDIVRDLAHKC